MSLALLGHAVRADKTSGRPLPAVWKTLANAGVHFRRGQLVLIGAGSGTGKSAYALTLAIKSGAKTIYFSADSGPGTQQERSVAMMTGKTVTEIQRAVQSGKSFDEYLPKNIRWEFDAGPTLEDIKETSDAYADLHGEYAELIIVDNLLNVVSDDAGEGGYRTNENILLYLLELARYTGACVVVLTHLVGEYDDGVKAPPMSALRDKVSKIPELILTLWRQRDEGDPKESLGVAIVKNRGGVANAAANYTVTLALDFEHMRIEDEVFESSGFEE